jgi:hypothetical protein
MDTISKSGFTGNRAFGYRVAPMIFRDTRCDLQRSFGKSSVLPKATRGLAPQPSHASGRLRGTDDSAAKIYAVRSVPFAESSVLPD